MLKFENPVIRMWALAQYFCRKKLKESISNACFFSPEAHSLFYPSLLLLLLNTELFLWESDLCFGGFGMDHWTRWMKICRIWSVMMKLCPDIVAFSGFIKFCHLWIYYRYTDSPNCYYELYRNGWRWMLFRNLELASGCWPFLEKLGMFHSFLK